MGVFDLLTQRRQRTKVKKNVSFMNIGTRMLCKICNGRVLEKISLKYGQSNGIIGPGSYTPAYVTSEGFSCEKCGLMYRPTRQNDLEHQKIGEAIQEIMYNYIEIKVIRPLSEEEIVPLNEVASIEEFKSLYYREEKIAFVPYYRHANFHQILREQEANYYIIKSRKGSIVIDDSVKYKKVPSKILKQIGSLNLKSAAKTFKLVPIPTKIPKNAIKAALVFVVDRDFKKHYFYIPSDAIEKNNL